MWSTGHQIMLRSLPALLAVFLTASALAAPIKVLVVADSPDVLQALPALIQQGGAQAERNHASAGRPTLSR